MVMQDLGTTNGCNTSNKQCPPRCVHLCSALIACSEPLYGTVYIELTHTHCLCKLSCVFSSTFDCFNVDMHICNIFASCMVVHRLCISLLNYNSAIYLQAVLSFLMIAVTQCQGRQHDNKRVLAGWGNILTCVTSLACSSEEEYICVTFSVGCRGIHCMTGKFIYIYIYIHTCIYIYSIYYNIIIISSLIYIYIYTYRYVCMYKLSAKTMRMKQVKLSARRSNISIYIYI